VRIAVTGGIGSGKSAVTSRLAQRGAVVVDADVLARAVVAPGTPGFTAVVKEFGRDVVAADGSLDRAALAAIVFTDPVRRSALEAIVHPLVAAESAALLDSAPESAVVVYDVPLLAESGVLDDDSGRRFDTVVVVTAPLEVRVERLVARGMSEQDARARIDAQASDEQRRALADHVVDNSGDLTDLDAAVASLWDAL
jgi:dephospho-CoA kinase